MVAPDLLRRQPRPLSDRDAEGPVQAYQLAW
jgi:hypothetical protein